MFLFISIKGVTYGEGEGKEEQKKKALSLRSDGASLLISFQLRAD